MRGILRNSIIILIMGCASNGKRSDDLSQGERAMDSKEEPGILGTKGDEKNLDSLVMITGKDYRSNPGKHPMMPFYLSYDEWKTIGCIIAINKDSYWNKTIIGVIEKSNQLRLKVNNEDIHLVPGNLIEFKKGTWRNTYNNDSISVNVLIDLKEGEILRNLAGNGIIEIEINDMTYTEIGYFVAKVQE